MDPTGMEDEGVQPTDSDNDEDDEIADKKASNDYLANKAIEEKYERLRDRVDLNFDHYGLSAKDIRDIQYYANIISYLLKAKEKYLTPKLAGYMMMFTGSIVTYVGAHATVMLVVLAPATGLTSLLLVPPTIAVTLGGVYLTAQGYNVLSNDFENMTGININVFDSMELLEPIMLNYP